MNTTAQIQEVNDANTAGTLLTTAGALLRFDKPPSITNTLSPGDLVTCRCIFDSTQTNEVMAVIVSVP